MSGQSGQGADLDDLKRHAVMMFRTVRKTRNMTLDQFVRRVLLEIDTTRGSRMSEAARQEVGDYIRRLTTMSQDHVEAEIMARGSASRARPDTKSNFRRHDSMELSEIMFRGEDLPVGGKKRKRSADDDGDDAPPSRRPYPGWGGDIRVFGAGSSTWPEPSITACGPVMNFGEVAAPSEPSKLQTTALDEDRVRYWAGVTRKTFDGQNKVMGVSATIYVRGLAVNNAYPILKDVDHDTRKRWEWLHLIAFSMGGGGTDGPQQPGNMVCGSYAANSAMLALEEAIKNFIRNHRGARLTLEVEARLRPFTHLATSIAYRVSGQNKQGKDDRFKIDFDPLSHVDPPHGGQAAFTDILNRTFG